MPSCLISGTFRFRSPCVEHHKHEQRIWTTPGWIRRLRSWYWRSCVRRRRQHNFRQRFHIRRHCSWRFLLDRKDPETESRRHNSAASRKLHRKVMVLSRHNQYCISQGASSRFSVIILTVSDTGILQSLKVTIGRMWFCDFLSARDCGTWNGWAFGVGDSRWVLQKIIDFNCRISGWSCPVWCSVVKEETARAEGKARAQRALMWGLGLEKKKWQGMTRGMKWGLTWWLNQCDFNSIFRFRRCDGNLEV